MWGHKNVNLSKLKAFADYNLKLAAIIEFVFDRVENIMEKRANAGYHNVFKSPYLSCLLKLKAEPHSSIGSVVDLRTAGRWFDPRLGQHSIRRLMIVIVTGFIPLSLLSVVSTMVMWESSQWLRENIVRSTG